MPSQNWHPPKYTIEQHRALQALDRYASGEGEMPGPEDVRRVFDWLINEASGTYDEPFRPGAPDQVNYMLGRRSVGLAIVKLLRLKPQIFKDG